MTLTPCAPWATEADLCSPCNDYALDSGLMEDKLDLATYILFMASGQRYRGLCEETIRPCTQRTMSEFYGPAALARSFPWNFACGCGTYDRCSCSRLSTIELPHYPVTDVSEVLVDGSPFTAYRVDAFKYLVRTDGESWNCCQDLSLPTTEPDTLSVTYTWGYEPPVPAINAAAILACELYQSCEPEGFEAECRLPRNIAALARQGVTMAFQLVDELFSPRAGKPISFGIPEIDMWLAVENPHGITSPSVIMSPDDPDLARRVDT